jgi:hypothetical protein
LESISPKPAEKGLKYWCEDETRIGLKTIERKRITALGIKPIGKVQGNFKAYYLYGAVAPQTGESFWLEFSHLDGICFQMFLDKLAKGLLNNRSLFQEQERSRSESWVKNKFFCIELPHLYSATRYS